MMNYAQQIKEALEDAGIEAENVTGKRAGMSKEWHYQDPKSGEFIKLGDSFDEAMAAIAKMPNPNEATVEQDGPQTTISPETHPHLFDDFCNPA